MEAWIPLAIVRAEVVKDQVLGGYGAVLRCLLRQMFLGPLGISAAGVVLPLEGEATLITISFSNFLWDEEFLNKSLDYKGASGLLCCMGCKNTTLCSSGLAERGEGISSTSLKRTSRGLTCVQTRTFGANAIFTQILQ